MMVSVLRGAAAGAAGTTALNGVTYLDMVLRGRGPSSAPEETAERLLGHAGVAVPGRPANRRDRLSGAGALLGILTGVAVGAAAGAARRFGWRPSRTTAVLTTTAAAMTASDVPMAALGVSDPRRWRPRDWASDVLPHLAFGLATTWTLDATSRA
ncbi:hypothetical protein C1701_05195 [Actinoalloteichus sp. AHMU CJ021]|uniref:DUF1440 domain-containing protein n=1 Tax=Actinoalloteichus caeruleus DSM 43889 TaxID=1120930 RepID=A0ABT1JHP4_ACTCY|nr:hypothetical protein [Actinoalloteichus caeruleus]AUS77863.1 hypothetical protein C1701_05195 [Actinoalloteichus sp. AHMU CJ021]MCP2331819.1 hypothetical protein [Actinoalloteichus caeruleus DSM 43889]